MIHIAMFSSRADDGDGGYAVGKTDQSDSDGGWWW